MRKGIHFVHVGFGNVIKADAVMCILSPQSVCAKRMVKVAKADGVFIDLCMGHRLRSVLVSDTGVVIGCAVRTLTMAQRFNEALMPSPFLHPEDYVPEDIDPDEEAEPDVDDDPHDEEDTDESIEATNEDTAPDD